jgi:hypothetical protein
VGQLCSFFSVSRSTLTIADVLQYYATDSQDHLTHQSGTDVDVRNAFVNDGRLANSADGNFRAIYDSWPVFGYGVDLGWIGASPVSTLFSLGLCQDEAIQFLGADGLTVIPSLWKSYFADDLAAVSGNILLSIETPTQQSLLAFTMRASD